jgi:predicted KAP-like P-loop ATPase|tara:strand:- start:281 stop:658 length:378 start_codon:yes stop_codon:yes gene_type:complete
LVAASLRGIVYDAATRDAKTAALSLAVADVVGRIAGPVTRQMDGLELAAESAEKTALTAVAAAKKTEKEHDALFAGVAKAIANLEAESKAQKKAIAAVVVSVEKLTKCTKAHEDAVKAMAAAAAK